MQVHERFEQRTELLLLLLLPSLLGDGVRLTQRVVGLRQLTQGVGILFLLRPRRLGLQVDLVAQGDELPQQRMQVDGLGGGRGCFVIGTGSDRQVREPGAEIGQDGFDGLWGQGLAANDSRVLSDTRRRGLRHSISSRMASMDSFLPASNSR